VGESGRKVGEVVSNRRARSVYQHDNAVCLRFRLRSRAPRDFPVHRVGMSIFTRRDLKSLDRWQHQISADQSERGGVAALHGGSVESGGVGPYSLSRGCR
jgi:hypothetical protein